MLPVRAMASCVLCLFLLSLPGTACPKVFKCSRLWSLLAFIYFFLI